MSCNNTDDNPQFSIIIPTYNRPKMLIRAMDSVFNQTFTDYELIIVDDGSSINNSMAIAINLNNKRVNFIRTFYRNGAAEARNLGIRMARGKYISFLDDDDEYPVDYLENTYRLLENTTDEIGLSWCGARFIDYSSSGDVIADHRTRDFPDKYKSDAHLFEAVLSIGIGFGVTIKAHCLKKIGPFNSSLCTVEDTDILIRLLMYGYLPSFIPKTKILIHNHCRSRLTDNSMNTIRINECHWLLNEYESFFTQYPSLKKQLKIQINHLLDELENRINMNEYMFNDRPRKSIQNSVLET